MRSAFGKASLALAAVISATFCTTTSGLPQWSAGANFPTTLARGAGAWFAPNGRFYVMGGRASDVAGSDFLSPSEYDPGSNTWTLKAAVFNDNQVNNMVAGVLSDAGTPYIYCVGGSAAGAATATDAVRRYDPIADSITVVTTDPWPGGGTNTLPGGGAVFNNKLYIFGGFVINVSMASTIWEFDPALPAGSRWTLKSAALPVAMGYIPVAQVGSQIYIGAGTTFSGGLLFDSTNSYAYDPLLDTITAIAATPRATGETRAVSEGGRVWVLGGGRTAPNPSNQVDSYALGPNSWSVGPAFTTARRNIAADVDPATGNIYMAGGYAPATATNSFEIYTGSPCGAPVTYCTPKTNSLGCVPSIGSTGTPSATAGSGFTVSVTNVMNNKSGLFFYGVTGPAAIPFQAGFLCVRAPVKRTAGLGSGGNPPPNDCSGVFSIDMNAFAVSAGPPVPLAALQVPGTLVDCQVWGRDPGYIPPDNTALSDGLEYTICP